MNNKRKLLLLLPAASAATVWTKPVVNSVLLPVHATTTEPSLTEITFTGTCSTATPNDQFYSITFLPDPAVTGAMVHVSGPSAVAPILLGDAIHIHAQHTLTQLLVVFTAQGGGNPRSDFVRNCGAVNTAPFADQSVPLLGGSTLLFDVIFSQSGPTSPTIMLSNFRVV